MDVPSFAASTAVPPAAEIALSSPDAMIETIHGLCTTGQRPVCHEGEQPVYYPEMKKEDEGTADEGDEGAAPAWPLFDFIKSQDLEQAEFATKLGVSRQALSNWKRRGIPLRMVARVARAMGGMTYDEYIAASEARRSKGKMRPSLPRVGRVGFVPIIGFAIATPKGDGYFDEMYLAPDAATEFASWPSKDPDAYALWIKGDSMQPRIRPGEVIVVAPNHALVQGKDVVVRTKDGRKMVKQLLFQRPGEVTLGSINQTHQQITLSMEEVESIHYVEATAHSTIEGA